MPHPLLQLPLALLQLPIHTVGLALLVLSAAMGVFAFVRHGRDGSRGWKLPAILAAVLGVSGLLLRSVQYTGELPAVDHPLVLAGVEKAIRQAAGGADIQSIDRHAQTLFDETNDRRLGFCVAHAPNRDIFYSYAVQWTDRPSGKFQVTAVPLVLPSCTDKTILESIEKSLREGPLAADIVSIAEHKEIAIDEKNHRRQGQCVAQLKDRATLVNYFVQWDDPLKGTVGVTTAPLDLPACDSQEVLEGLQAILKNLPNASEIESIDELQQVRFERSNLRRLGKATVHGKAGSQPMFYTVEWNDPAQGMFIIKPHPGDVPECASPEVIQSVEAAVRGTEAGKEAKSVDGHREIRFDADKNQREGECVVHLEDKDVPVKFTIRWANEATGQFLVEVPKELVTSP